MGSGWLGELWRRVLFLFRRRRFGRELGEEIRFHLEMRARANREAGMEPDEAAHAAQRKFGNPTLLEERSRDAWGWTRLESWIQDLRFAGRMLGRSPSITAISVVTLALGIGATTAIFSVVDGVLIRPLPYGEAGRLMMVYASFAPQNVARGWLSPADYLDWSAQNRAFEETAAFARSGFTVRGIEEPRQVLGALVTSGFFSVLKAKPLLGRVFVPSDERPGGPRAVVIGERLWRQSFGGDPRAIGRTILLGNQSATIAGVMPAAFDFPQQKVELWAALQLEPPTRRGPFFLRGLGRLKPGVSREQAQAELDVIARRIEQAYPKTYARLRFPVVPLHEAMVGEFRPALAVTLAAVLLLLVVACVNVANLLLARATARDREMAVRVSIGAGRWRLARQLLTESTVLALAGGLAGMALAFWGLDLLRAVMPGELPLRHVRIDARILAFSLLVSVLTGIAFGFAPALRIRRFRLNEALRAGGRMGPSGGRGNRTGSGLVVAQVALCFVLLMAAGLLLKSFLLLRGVDPGFAARDVLVMTLAPAGPKYAAAGSVQRFYTEALDRVRPLPGVEVAAVANGLPPDQIEFSDSFTIEGQAFAAGSNPSVPVVIASAEYFRALGIRLLAGRYLGPQDTADSAKVCVISESLARRFFTHENPLGRRLKIGGPELAGQPWREIVGVVADVKYHGLAAPVEPAYYLPYTQVPGRWMYLYARAKGDPSALAAAVRAEVRALDREVMMAVTTTVERVLADSIAQPRFRTWLVCLFAGTALALAAVGIYGVIAWSVAERRHEFGVRFALGARKSDVLGLVLMRTARLLMIGAGAGLAGAVGAGRVLRGLLFGVGATDPLTFLGVCAVVFAAGLLASWLPARRAARVDPMAALRYE